MKHKQILFFLFFVNFIYSQCLPDHPDPNYVNHFNWEIGQTMPINTTCQPNSLTSNPFKSSQTELLPISMIEDFKKDDGWEAIAYNLGYDHANSALSVRPDHGYVMLYNKYRGILRILVKWCSGVHYNGATLTLEFAPGFETNLLDMGAQEKPILAPHNTGSNITTALKFYNDSNSWAYADFKMNYDPCTCTIDEHSRLRLYTQLIQSSSVNLSGSITGSIVSASQNSGQVNSNGAFWSNLDNINSKMTKAHGKIEDFKKTYGETFKKLKDAGVTVNAINKLGDMLNNNKFLKAGLSVIPVVGQAVSFLSGLFGGGADSQGPMELGPLSVDLSVNLKGSITTVNPMHNATIGVPGSEKSDFYPGIMGGQPLFDETMGVFALIDEPKMYYQDYIDQIYKTPSILSLIYKDSYTIRKYKLDGSTLRYKINPSSNLELQDAEFMVVSEYEKPSLKFLSFIKSLQPPSYADPNDDYDTENGLDFPIRIDSNNLGIYNQSKKGNCIDRENFIFQNAFPAIGHKHFKNDYAFEFMYDFQNINLKDFFISGVFIKPRYSLMLFNQIPRIKNLKLKLILNLKRKDDPNAQNVLYVVTYPIKLVPAPQGYDMNGSNYASDAKSYRENPDAGMANKLVPVTDDELAQVCKSSLYKLNRARTAAVITPVIDTSVNAVTVSPNPFTDRVTIDSKQNTLINLMSWDGKIVKDFQQNFTQSLNTKQKSLAIDNFSNRKIIDNENQNPHDDIENVLEVDLSNLEKGIYFLNYSNPSGARKTIKIIKN